MNMSRRRPRCGNNLALAVLFGALLLHLGCDQAATMDEGGAEGEAANYADGWGPPVGSMLSTLTTVDGSGAAQTLETLRGEKGLLLFLNRSADW